MGDFFEDLGKRITETAGAVTKKTEEVVETQKIKSQIRVEERNKERDLQHLGKLVYDRFQKGEVIDTVFVAVSYTHLGAMSKAELESWLLGHGVQL